MDTDRLNKWLSLAANTGVLIGIIFLAVEIRQNNEILAAEVRATNFQSGADVWRMVAESPKLSELIVKDATDESMSDAEKIQIRALWTRYQLSIQWAWKEMPEEEFLRFLPWQKFNYSRLPEYREAWNGRRELFDPEFVRYMEENVFIGE